MISIIAAVGDNNEIGKNGDLCWKIKADLDRFKELTNGNVVVMGYNTFKSLDFKPLKDRRNIVITNYPIMGNDVDQVVGGTFCDVEAEEIKYGMDEFVKYLKGLKEEVFIIGGGSVYKEFLPIVDKMYITEIHKTDDEADTFFPDKKEWEKDFTRVMNQDTEEYTYVTYTRKKKPAKKTTTKKATKKAKK